MRMNPEFIIPVSEVGQKREALSWRSALNCTGNPSRNLAVLRPFQQRYRASFTISNLLLLKVTNLVSVSRIESRLAVLHELKRIT